ncbi:group II intron reverse transcriptase/maturase [Thalassomonas actiniarum]|uniref:Group II intron reverse transcriptase/maturase n=1 Tax=Thalassomonas actiniarum TaxID=485447 RepID=A0AAE9YW67_9GAMM|nr:group II intron reverse transcriptase/maturase [Thalassomonas actiniarum]WDE01489.1 group II intron reverse transcriptase/maturase [Thalassomonas actiniarum]
MTTELNTIAFKAYTHPKHRFQNLYGLLSSDRLYQSWGQLNKQAAPGIDGVTINDYQQSLPENIKRLSEQLKQKCYRANDIKRIFIPKSNGKQRPLGLPTVDDKLVQQSVSQILQSIWEQDFLVNSYGYRPNKSAHQAVHSLSLNLQFKGYGYVVEADIKGFFDNLDHGWLLRMLKQRIDDKALLKLISQWLKARIKSPEGVFEKPASGSPQGGIISPVLANIYLHYALDLWFEKKVKPRMRGRAMMIRYADDFVCAFQFAHDAERFYGVLAKRLKKFNLDIAPEKTSLMTFSRFKPGKSRHFVFLGFEFYWGIDVKGKRRLRRCTAAKKQKAMMSEYYQWIKAKRSIKLREWLPQLKRKLTGFRNYFGLPDNSRSLSRLYNYVLHSLYKWLNRRSGRRSYNWSSFKKMLEYFQIESPKVSSRNVIVDWY